MRLSSIQKLDNERLKLNYMHVEDGEITDYSILCKDVESLSKAEKIALFDYLNDNVEQLSKVGFNKYQEFTDSTAIYPDKGNNLIYPLLGLAGETGEIFEKVKKVIRDNKGVIEQEKKEEIKKELGDVLWYLATICTELNINLQDVVNSNINKLTSRKERNVINGSGDNR